MKFKKKFVLIVASITLFFLVISFYSSISYANVKNLKLEQGIYTNAIELNATNPTNFPAKFPETSLEVYINEIHYGTLNIEETTIAPEQSMILPATFVLDEEGLKKLEGDTGYTPSIVKYNGTATTYFFGLKSTMPFEIEKTINDEELVINQW